MRLGEAFVVHSFQEVDLVLLAVRKVNRQSISAPNELKVKLALFVGEGLENAPETLNDLMVGTAVVILANALEQISLHGLLSTCSNLDRSRRQIRNHVEVVHEYDAHAILNCLDLFCCL